MNTYTWKVAAMDVAKSQDGLTDVVVGIHYTVDCADGEDSVGAYGSIPCGPVDPQDFISYENLSESQAISWVKAVVNEAEVEAQLSQALALKKDPPVIQKPLPWAPPAQ
jgi:hypothetical protein